ncbi:MAG: outer membrane lipoprotein carrier protein LolA [Saprospiraceae bacterium]|nr:outer membrane lipoprotein carrier protein LolA [Saprospiraceae bacterium]
MKSLLTIVILFSCLFRIEGKPDPKLSKILAKVESQVLTANTLSIEFTLETTPAEMKKITQKGKMGIKKNKYYLILPEQEVYFDGNSQYTHLKERKEVQISSSDGRDFPFHPIALAGLYKKGQYDYRLESENNEYWVVDFKPLDKKAEYFKVKLHISKKNYQMAEVQIFEKNGDRHKLVFHSMNFNKSLEDSLFVLNVNKLQNVRVEDLR